MVYLPLFCVYDLAGDISQRSKFTFFLNMVVNERSNSYVDLHYLSFELDVCRCPFSDRSFYLSIDLLNYSNHITNLFVTIFIALGFFLFCTARKLYIQIVSLLQSF